MGIEDYRAATQTYMHVYPNAHMSSRGLHNKFLFDRTIQKNDEIYKYMVKVEGVLISPLNAKKEEQRVVRVVEKRAMTLQEALTSDLSIDEKKVIAFDVSQCLSFLHSENIAFCNLVPNAVSVS